MKMTKEELNTIVSQSKAYIKSEDSSLGATVKFNKNNVVSGDKLRNIQSDTLKETREYLAKTFGPMGSNTKIIKGTNQADVDSSYSKDGLKVLSNIINSAPIEASIVEELVGITKAVEKEVGDGTTSTVILSSLIFDRLRVIEDNYNIPPFMLCRKFQEVVEDIKTAIESKAKEVTLDDIYNIAMISTNGNTTVAENIKTIYEQYGMDVELSVGISNNENSVLKVYDGLTITEGMSDPVYINNKQDNTSEIHNARVYHFVDPIDDMAQIALFEAILRENIYSKYENNEDPIPTVITCPRISKDLSATLKTLANQLYQFDNQGAESAKPPILIITNVIASDEIIMDDIANLCGCKSIRKYIDADVYKKDVESGEAPTVDTISDFGGYAELVIADSKKTKFINPKYMVSEDGNEDPHYTAMVNFLETEIEQAQNNSEDVHTIGLLKKRLSALKANMVDYLVGGVTISERDMEKDLVEDAIKNCKSAALYGYGYAANFEGLRASLEVYNEYSLNHKEKIKIDIANAIFAAYVDAAYVLYGTVELDPAKIEDAVYRSIENEKPFDISQGFIPEHGSDSVICSIKLDQNILSTISKIITMMATSNQVLLMATTLNNY